MKKVVLDVTRVTQNYIFASIRKFVLVIIFR